MFNCLVSWQIWNNCNEVQHILREITGTFLIVLGLPKIPFPVNQEMLSGHQPNVPGISVFGMMCLGLYAPILMDPPPKKNIILDSSKT